MANLIAHIRHVAELVGADHVALGTDFIDIARVPMDLPASTFMERVGDAEFMEQLDVALAEEGFDEADRSQILCENVRRLWRAALQPKRSAGSAETP